MKITFSRIAISLSAILALSACNHNKRLADLYTIPNVRTSVPTLNAMAPPGMIYVPAGTIIDKPSITDTAIAGDTSQKRVTVSAFFMDKTEVTNKQYRTFVDWVADSVAITDYLKDPKYFVKVDKPKAVKSGGKKGSPAIPEAPIDTNKRINWNQIDGREPLWKSTSPEIRNRLINQMVYMENGELKLNEEKVKYSFTHLVTNRQGVSKYATEYIPVLPDTKVWTEDFPNAQMEMMDNNYYTNLGYNDYPVVGVTWKQARCYINWRSKIFLRQVGPNSIVRTFNLVFNLPTEAQWEYAASYGMRDTDMNKLAAIHTTVRDQQNRKKKKDVDELIVNFKQREGDYAQDGATTTMPVKSYAPNKLGLYNMLGNVSEWTLDAFSPSYKEFIHDLNPVLLYDANDNDSEILRRKVVRGGSWKDNGSMLSPINRSYELQNVSHSYIGFRCVMPAPDITPDQVKTRKIAKL
ncbi:SUMF1/EgtB/PvdO family nonheme iron enzyme [Mucilaginibacter robiniae]|uniref:SUMF1/EgtB/PvdO family nonheme iron enzyme n=1 Tax=Mucilaginibacter robiniae TaxID=2728022 RepID=A0A7L5E5C9_9SPHI|nr:SUMF1/EgtB/PvdO family nonheme iron enzyme [Mucilaginibacter robiniae]QJD96964.1 SUMF1/EgtB/PvdO family nonheme iron enzyme [Mucilaginibacter robiniae]